MSVTAEDVRLRMAQFLRIPEQRVTPGAVLTDLVAESFQLVEMAIELQEEYDVLLGQADLQTLRTAGDLSELICSRISHP